MDRRKPTLHWQPKRTGADEQERLIRVLDRLVQLGEEAQGDPDNDTLRGDFNRGYALWRHENAEAARAVEAFITYTHCPSVMAMRLMAHMIKVAWGQASDPTLEPDNWVAGKSIGCTDCEAEFRDFDELRNHRIATGHEMGLEEDGEGSEGK